MLNIGQRYIKIDQQRTNRYSQLRVHDIKNFVLIKRIGTQEAAKDTDAAVDVAQHLNMEEEEGLPNVSSMSLIPQSFLKVIIRRFIFFFFFSFFF